MQDGYSLLRMWVPIAEGGTKVGFRFEAYHASAKLIPVSSANQVRRNLTGLKV
jgi:hypothetical protein